MNIVWIVLGSIIGVLLLIGTVILIQDMMYYKHKDQEAAKAKQEKKSEDKT